MNKQSNQNQGYQIDKETKQELEEAFSLFDLHNTGQINARELKAIMQAFGIEARKEDIRLIYQEINRDPNKDSINEDEFFRIMINRLIPKDSDESISKMFELFDLNGDGKISISDLKKTAEQVDPNLEEDELNEMFDEADQDQDGFISKEEFTKIMKRKGNAVDDLTSDEDE